LSGRGRLRDLAIQQGVASREEKWRLYERTFPPRRGERILDVGASSRDDLPGENYFLARYPYPEQVTAVGVDDLEGLASRHPRVSFVHADGRALPFEGKSFDVVHSNAVVEHVGPLDEQSRFVRELVRVGRSGFVTTPNRWFPIEAHAHLPLVHWLPRGALERTMGRLGHSTWPVWLLSRSSFLRLFPAGSKAELHVQRMAGWPATLIAIFRG
jgi:SAM-dependent methyltransferase